MKELIIAEKPSVAIRIAYAISNAKPKLIRDKGINYFYIKEDDKEIYVVAAAGHLFTLKEKKKSNELPVFDIEWAPSYKINKRAYFTKRYLDIITSIGKDCNRFINACDYDLEGTVIGTNIIRYLQNNDPNKEINPDNVLRMKFSTTTRNDLRNSYENIEPYDANNFSAGETRHIIDWLWGINLSRALMKAIERGGRKKILSIGRVQGPTLHILAVREREINSFVPKPYYKLYLLYNKIQFNRKKGNIENKEEALKLKEKLEHEKKIVSKNEKKRIKILPLPPFDLTSLQIEASKILGLDPSRTLAIAQSLYEHSYISYPRTSSQKLPYSLNLPRIIKDLAKQKEYKELANFLIENNLFKPREGKKEDEAHPAIYPTGEIPKNISNEEMALYNLIVKRFLSVFAPPLVVDEEEVTIKVDDEEFVAKGKKVIERGWLDFYNFVGIEEKEINVKEGQELDADIKLEEKMTEPPRRFTKATLIKLLEDKNLGTKATRAAIIDTLFDRGYIIGKEIKVTNFGFSIHDTLEKYSKEILEEELTRKLEEDMNLVQKGIKKEDEVIEEGKRIIYNIIEDFKKKENEIGSELISKLKESEKENSIGKCPKCGGDLILYKTKAGKNFVRCSNWPKCDVSYPLPSFAYIKPTGKVCEICKTPIVKVFKGKKVFEMDLDPNCPTKKNWNKKLDKK